MHEGSGAGRQRCTCGASAAAARWRTTNGLHERLKRLITKMTNEGIRGPNRTCGGSAPAVLAHPAATTPGAAPKGAGCLQGDGRRRRGGTARVQARSARRCTRACVRACVHAQLADYRMLKSGSVPAAAAGMCQQQQQALLPGSHSGLVCTTGALRRSSRRRLPGRQSTSGGERGAGGATSRPAAASPSGGCSGASPRRWL